MFTHDTKPDKTILIYSKHQLTLELSPLSEFRSLSEFRRPSSYTDMSGQSFWVFLGQCGYGPDIDFPSGFRYSTICVNWSVWPWWSANSFFKCQRVLKLFSSSAYFLNVIMTFVFLKEFLVFEWFDIPSRYPSRLQSENKIFRSTRCLQNYQKSTKYNRYFFYLEPPWFF